MFRLMDIQHACEGDPCFIFRVIPPEAGDVSSTWRVSIHAGVRRTSLDADFFLLEVCWFGTVSLYAGQCGLPSLQGGSHNRHVFSPQRSLVTTLRGEVDFEDPRIVRLLVRQALASLEDYFGEQQLRLMSAD